MTASEPDHPASVRIVSVRFKNYKALRSFTVHLRSFNVLVGPNNAGKSTILGVFRILSEGLRRAASRSAEPVRIAGNREWGHRVSLEDLPVSTENIFTDYDDSEPALVAFALSNGCELQLVFQEVGSCILVAKAPKVEVRTPSAFKRHFPVSIGFVPILGPVEHDEPLYQREAARNALLSHRASRNFRNIWYHFPDDFDDFRALIKTTWPGMDIEPPTVVEPGKRPKLTMFCPEERYPREIYWAGFGFQVWCQLLTYAIRSKRCSVLIIDEPDIYLHSDLQRQLLSFLQSLGPDIVLATHSTEIVPEVDPSCLLVVNKKNRTAQHVKNVDQLQRLFGALGSNLNPTLTQLAKTKRVLFVEGKDFSLLSSFARRLGKSAVANRSDFAVVPLGGFSATKVVDMAAGFKEALGSDVKVAVILDRDYRADEEVSAIKMELSGNTVLAHVHERKELENFLLVPAAIQRALAKKITDNVMRGGKRPAAMPQVTELLEQLADELKADVLAQAIAARSKAARRPGGTRLDPSTINAEVIRDFEKRWGDSGGRYLVVPGKQLFASLSGKLHSLADVQVTPAAVIEEMREDEVPREMEDLISRIDSFRRT